MEYANEDKKDMTRRNLMSKGKKKISDKEIRSRKKDEILKQKKSNKLPIIALAIGIIVTVIAVFYFLNRSPNTLAETGIASAPAVSSDSFKYDAAGFDDGKARFFEYPDEKGNTIKFFILKSSDGVIRAAFDACDVCWRAGKGYVQDGDQMVCRNCGRRFDSVRINEVKGGCNPAPLRRTLQGDKLIIKVKDILEGSVYFDFKGRT
jgi:uncharacterized membrane protein